MKKGYFIICTGIAERVAIATYDNSKPVIAPTIPFGYSDIPDKEVQIILSEMNKSPVWGHACLIETSVSEVFGAEVREDKVVGRIPNSFPEELLKLPAGTTGGGELLGNL